MTKASFELQFMLNTRLATLDKFPIRLGDLMVVDLDGTALPETCVWSNQPDVRLQELVCVGLGADRYYHRPIFQNGWIPKTDTWRCVLAIDPAGRGADELAWAVVAELNGNMFLLESDFYLQLFYKILYQIQNFLEMILPLIIMVIQC